MNYIFLVREGKHGDFLNVLTQSDSRSATKREGNVGWVFVYMGIISSLLTMIMKVVFDIV
jgi:hypothetical protein